MAIAILALTYSASGFQYADNAGSGVSGSLSRAVGETVASYAINQGTLAANANYTISYTGANLMITPPRQRVERQCGEPRRYGIGNSQPSTARPACRALQLHDRRGADLAAGNGQSEDVTFTPTDSLDYNTAPLTVTVNAGPGDIDGHGRWPNEGLRQ